MTARPDIEEEHLPLWSAPTQRGEPVRHLWIQSFAPARAHAVAVAVLPGGGYGINEPEEGRPLARALAARGFWTFVLPYRVEPARHPSPLVDAVQGVRRVRQLCRGRGASQPRALCLLGLSAGAHLAGLTALRHGTPADDDPDLRLSKEDRPDLLALMYPLLSLDPPTHTPSVQRLLGPGAPDAARAALDVIDLLDGSFPPVLLVHALDDTVIPATRSAQFLQRCVEVGVPVDARFPNRGGHGFLRAEGPDSFWIDRICHWLREREAG